MSVIVKKLSQLLDILKKSYKSKLRQGKNPETVDIENEIVELILMNLSLGVSISSMKFIIKACSLDTELKQNIRTLKKWCYKLFKRYIPTFRARTHVP